MTWIEPEVIGILPPIYQIQCSPNVACSSKTPSTNRIENTSGLSFTYNDLQPNVAYTFHICTHNAMSISNNKGRVNCADKLNNDKTITKDGCKLFFLIAVLNWKHFNISFRDLRIGKYWKRSTPFNWNLSRNLTKTPTKGGIFIPDSYISLIIFPCQYLCLFINYKIINVYATFQWIISFHFRSNCRSKFRGKETIR